MSRRLLSAWFGGERDILAATRATREAGYQILDVYTPYAVHGLDNAAGLRPSRLPWVCFALGLTGAVAKLWYQIWTSATSWALNVGGKPFKSVPAFVPVTFEMMVLFAAVGTVVAFFIVSGLRPGRKPRHVYDRTTNDLFALVLVQHDAGFDIAAVRDLLSRHNLVRLEERIEVPEVKTAPGSFLLKPALGWGLTGALVIVVALTYLLPRTFTEPNSEFLPGMVESVPYDPLSANTNFADGMTLRTPPSGTIARGHMPWDSSRAGTEASLVAAYVSTLSPDQLSDREARAASVFATFCQPCHGPAGKGDGTIPARGYPAPPSLDATNALKLTDGQIFNILTYGRGNMPSLAGRIPVNERWLAVQHVRRIQEIATAAATVATPPAGGTAALNGKENPR